MDDLSTAFSDDGASYLSEGASVDSEDTNLVSNVTKKEHYGNGYGHDSPTDVRYLEENDMGMMGGSAHGEPLPIVQEGMVLNEEMYHMDSATSHMNNMQMQMDSYAQYEKEEDTFAREMNTTKIAFSAYRNAVLHLVQHQHKPKSSNNANKKDDDDDSDEENDGGDKASGSEPNANERMKLLENTAKTLVETKAKACFDAVAVANEFMTRREERMSGERNSLFQELLSKKTPKNKPMDISAELPVKETAVPKAVVTDNPPAVQTSNSSPKPATSKPKPTKQKTPTLPQTTAQKKVKKKTTATQEPAKSIKFVPCKKSSRHPDCILSTLPKFQYDNRVAADDDRRPDDEPTPARYRTTQW
eukprot:CAMPEP_0204641352 /NCGR_PEP_ID=MMETSP0717-20131115/51084_1 /ASSEMBLY_ACC=CAM_ASM_000666 /TAXON_ID=230516 /ORGANISM="Chaetoceros curvisetus" /LENGTH=358 /DNA_ID=CAMNT_0051662009 /DNA_START=57 /DNA_END=1130 /DNA_ORIENTATION=-